jgi:hypothetical protein
VYVFLRASTLPCKSVEAVSLRSARILSRGSGWYESKGFRSVIEAIEPRTYARTVGRLHTTPLDRLKAALTSIDAVVRSSLCSGSNGFGSMRIAKYGILTSEPELASPPSIVDVVGVIRSTSVALEILAAMSEKTLGSAVDHLIDRDCVAAGRLVHALLPHKDDAFYVVLSDLEGNPVPPLPMLEAWVFAWRLTSSYPELRLRL